MMVFYSCNLKEIFTDGSAVWNEQGLTLIRFRVFTNFSNIVCIAQYLKPSMVSLLQILW